PGAAAHGDAEPSLFVPADQVEQGQPFTVVGADMRPGVLVTLDLASYGKVTSLGTVAPAEDGQTGRGRPSGTAGAGQEFEGASARSLMGPGPRAR
ncbi:MAG TPA: hypothetical protein VK992_03765, partial [Candidatus Caenarcaniphilales bacterium]|nr:hypothetical protein [Candidatus Caenarcaniphilales bacterium]